MKKDRRHFLRTSMYTLSLLPLSGFAQNHSLPNIILCMSDDQGWGDTGYNGHPVLKTPNLDRMAQEGIRFDRFYSGAPVCSPTRASCLTGRHPFRQGIFGANSGHMKEPEITLAEALKPLGYTTGHFGKWHLGTLSTKIKDSNRGRPGDDTHYSPPWHNGFDECFSTEAKVPTWDPMITPDHWNRGEPGEEYGTYYWDGPEHRVTENLEGDDSRIIMDRAIDFIQRAAKKEKPFLAVIWFHTPHSPVVAGKRYRELYKDCTENEQHYYGCLTAMDEQIGRLRKELERLEIEQKTMIWFCSDNGPAGKGGGPTREPGGRQQGSSGPFRNRKGSLYEGGVRVPSVLVWPERIKSPRVVATPCSTNDYYPTVLDYLDIQIENQPRPLDGISLRPMLESNMEKRPHPIAFEHRNQRALIDNRYKLISTDDGKTYQLYDLIADPGESKDVSQQHPKVKREMISEMESWRQSCDDSRAGKDYAD